MSNHFILVSVTLVLEPVPGTPGIKQKYTLEEMQTSAHTLTYISPECITMLISTVKKHEGREMTAVNESENERWI